MTDLETELLDWVRLLERSIVYEIKRDRADREGVRLKTCTLTLVRETIARAEKQS